MNTAGRHIRMRLPISHRGFSIVECVIALPLMAAFLFMAAQLFHGCLAMVRYSSGQSMRTVQRQMIIRRLRADAQSSRTILLVNRRLLACHTPKGIINWQITPRGVVEREWRRTRRSQRPMTSWRSDAVMPSAYFRLSSRQVLRLYYLTHGRHRVVAAMPTADLLPRSSR